MWLANLCHQWCVRTCIHEDTHTHTEAAQAWEGPGTGRQCLILGDCWASEWPLTRWFTALCCEPVTDWHWAKNRSINTTLNVRNSGISQIAAPGFMNERRGAAVTTWHADEDNNNDDDNYHQQLKAKMAEWQSKAKWASKLPGGRGAPLALLLPSLPSRPCLLSPNTATRSSLLEVQNSVEWEELCGWTKCCKMTGTIMTMNFMSPSHRARDAWLGWLVKLNCCRYSGRLSYYPRCFCQLLRWHKSRMAQLNSI